MCSVGGYVIPSFAIFDRKTLKPEMVTGQVPGTMYDLSSNEWMDTELFEQWFSHHFLAYAPPTLLLDGHSTHYQPNVIRTAAKEQVIVFASLRIPPI